MEHCELLIQDQGLTKYIQLVIFVYKTRGNPLNLLNKTRHNKVINFFLNLPKHKGFAAKTCHSFNNSAKVLQSLVKPVLNKKDLEKQMSSISLIFFFFIWS